MGYKEFGAEGSNIRKYHYLEEIEGGKFDYAIMMDSLEYMEDDVAYVTKVSSRLRKGGYFFFTLPAFSMLFSEHDVHVKNLRRYSRQSFYMDFAVNKTLSKIGIRPPGLSMLVVCRKVA